ncbi:MAG: hypothetical protein CG439_304 [Methylococcaceae bacterium NSP1-2]|nr:MAG: hypothetical protein CG439_304 [Methylococcaceae bacterium NSP1-2]
MTCIAINQCFATFFAQVSRLLVILRDRNERGMANAY